MAKPAYQHKTIYLAHNGAELCVKIYRPSSRDHASKQSYIEMNKTPLLLLHGNAGSSHEFEKQIEHFAAERCVIALDSRGQGASSTSLTPELSYQLMADDALEVLDQLGVCQAHILGYSDGGILALLMALKAPRRIRSITCVGVNAQPEGLNKRSKWFISLAQKTLKLKLKLRDKESSDLEDTLFQIALSELMLYEPHISNKELASINLPCLLITGEKDDILPEHTQYLIETIPQAQHELIRGAKHYLLKSHAHIINPRIQVHIEQHDKHIGRRELSANPELSIRKLTQADKLAITQLFQELYQGLKTETDDSGWDENIYPQITLIDHALEADDFYGCFTQDGQLVSCMRLVYGMERNFDACGWEILQSSEVISPTMLICSPQARNKSVATSMLHFAYMQALKDPAIKALRLNTATLNIPAHYLYRSLGFKAYKPVFYPYEGLKISPWSCPFELRIVR